MRLLYINNDGGGFADHINVAEGMTVEQFFNERMPDQEPTDYLIRVNRQPVPVATVRPCAYNASSRRQAWEMSRPALAITQSAWATSRPSEAARSKRSSAAGGSRANTSATLPSHTDCVVARRE